MTTTARNIALVPAVTLVAVSFFLPALTVAEMKQEKAVFENKKAEVTTVTAQIIEHLENYQTNISKNEHVSNDIKVGSTADLSECAKKLEEFSDEVASADNEEEAQENLERVQEWAKLALKKKQYWNLAVSISHQEYALNQLASAVEDMQKQLNVTKDRPGIRQGDLRNADEALALTNISLKEAEELLATIKLYHEEGYEHGTHELLEESRQKIDDTISGVYQSSEQMEELLEN